MKKIALLALMLLSNNVFATMDIDVRIQVDQQTLEHKCVFQQENSVCAFGQEDLNAQVSADCGHDAALVTVKVFKRDETGQQVCISNPVIKAQWGKQAEVTLAQDGQVLSVHIKATK